MFKTFVSWLQKKRQERFDAAVFEREVVVAFDDDLVRVTYPDGNEQEIPWRSIVRVAIETNDSGPWGADVWWLLEGSDSKVAYPQGATGDPEMLGQFSSRFPGFDDESVIRAMGCTSNARFVCWEVS